jgi:hypothetical protein
MISDGNLLKMRVEHANPIQYYLTLDQEEIPMNELINKKIELKFLHKIHCIKCGRLTSTSFAQGYCFPCFREAPETEECVLRPELCRAHVGKARDMKYAREHCLIDHYVYLAYTSGIKVGVTRRTQIPVRWIDQGAVAAIRIARTPNRYTAGLIEVALKQYAADRTNWRNMLKNSELKADLIQEKGNLIGKLNTELQFYAIEDNTITYFEYPHTTYFPKISSITLDKTDHFTGKLLGIKGQYLIFDEGRVMNIRKHNGYFISLKF